MGMFDLAKGSDDEKERDRIALSCYLNTSQCYIKSADALGVCTTTSEKDKAGMIYRKALRACDSALETDAQSIKALYRKAFCLEKVGEIDTARKVCQSALDSIPEGQDKATAFPEVVRLDKQLERAQLLQKKKERKTYGKMFG